MPFIVHQTFHSMHYRTLTNCHPPYSPNSPVPTLIGKSGGLYIRVVVCCLLFVATLVAMLVITASSHSKCCPADQTRPDGSK